MLVSGQGLKHPFPVPPVLWRTSRCGNRLLDRNIHGQDPLLCSRTPHGGCYLPTNARLSNNVLALPEATAALIRVTCLISVVAPGVRLSPWKQSVRCPPRPPVPLMQSRCVLSLNTWQMFGCLSIADRNVSGLKILATPRDRY